MSVKIGKMNPHTYQVTIYIQIEPWTKKTNSKFISRWDNQRDVW